jgi:hypothetical protein
MAQALHGADYPLAVITVQARPDGAVARITRR